VCCGSIGAGDGGVCACAGARWSAGAGAGGSAASSVRAGARPGRRAGRPGYSSAGARPAAGGRSASGCRSVAERGSTAGRRSVAERGSTAGRRSAAERGSTAGCRSVAEHRADFRADRSQRRCTGPWLRASAGECARAGADAYPDHDAGERQRDVDQSAAGSARWRQYDERAADKPRQHPRDAAGPDPAAAGISAAGQHADADGAGHHRRSNADSDTVTANCLESNQLCQPVLVVAAWGGFYSSLGLHRYLGGLPVP
jgi:hypothetical protein